MHKHYKLSDMNVAMQLIHGITDAMTATVLIWFMTKVRIDVLISN